MLKIYEIVCQIALPTHLGCKHDQTSNRHGTSQLGKRMKNLRSKIFLGIIKKIVLKLFNET